MQIDCWSSSSCRLLNVLEIIAPFKHFNKLQELVQMKLPPGFPVKLGMCVSLFLCLSLSLRVCARYDLEGKVEGGETKIIKIISLFVFLSLADIPVFPTITATVTFQEFRYDEFEESIFYIPHKYKEDPCRFPNLWSVHTCRPNRKWPASWEGGKQLGPLVFGSYAYHPF